jgi:ATP-binding cassette subfamily F protein 3
VHTYDDKILFLDASLLIERGDRIAFLGPNGAGKSTLLRLIMGMEQPTEGTVTLGVS